MIHTDYFKGKRITVLGIARSGLACANLLYKLGAKVSVSDAKNNEVTRLSSSKLSSKDIGIELGGHTQDFIKGRDLVIVSPGIPDGALPLVWAREYAIPLISEIEFAWMLCPATVIAVTGSNGKTTVTTLIGKLLEAQGRRAFVCGNIGNPFSGEVDKMQEGDFVSLEVSSFQLEKIKTFKPKIAVILNFSRNHLDRHKDMQEYLEAKKRIFMNQDEHDYLVLNGESPDLRGLSAETRSQVVYFKETKEYNPNQAAVLTVASILKIDPSIALKVFHDFKGVEHRLEFVAEINKVKFINDSKATTVEAALWAIKSIPGKIILIAGGRDKGNDYTTMREVARQKVTHAILIGEARKKMEDAFRGFIPTEGASTLEEAVAKAFTCAAPESTVLLSPMCASYDMFTDYEHRGRVFKSAVNELASPSKRKTCAQ